MISIKQEKNYIVITTQYACTVTMITSKQCGAIPANIYACTINLGFGAYFEVTNFNELRILLFNNFIPKFLKGS